MITNVCKGLQKDDVNNFVSQVSDSEDTEKFVEKNVTYPTQTQAGCRKIPIALDVSVHESYTPEHASEPEVPVPCARAWGVRAASSSSVTLHFALPEL